jgi:propanol-preferring alcohol dehydrogenase
VVAAGRLGHFAGNKPVISSNFDQLILYAVQYGRAFGAQVLGIDGGSERGDFAKSIDAQVYIDVSATSNIIEHIRKITNGGAHAVVVGVCAGC